MVLGDFNCGGEDAGVRHLAGQGPFPDHSVEFLFLRGTLDVGIGDEGRPDGLVGLLGAFRAGLVLADPGILLAPLSDDEFLGGADREAAEVGGVGSHISDETAFIQLLGDAHRCIDGEVKFARGLLLKGGGGKRSRGAARPFLLLDALYGVAGPDAVLQEGAGFLFACEFLVQQGLDLDTGRGARGMESPFHFIVGLALEGHDLFFPFDDKTEGDALYAPGREFRLDLAPEDGGEFETDQPVENAARLLGVHEIHVDLPGMLNGFPYGVRGDFVVGDPPGAGGVEAEHLREVPGNGFTLAVGIGGQIDRLRLVGKGLEFLDDSGLVGRDLVFRPESVGDVHAEFLFAQVTDVPAGRNDLVLHGLLFQELADFPGLGR